jgi:hypothetical protein
MPRSSNSLLMLLLCSQTLAPTELVSYNALAIPRALYQPCSDIDWEYPGGNGGDYKQVSNTEKSYQIDAFPIVLAAIRAAIGNKLLSIAVPGKAGKSRYG